jgi:LuxR family transcriptional regulator, maltose regulon positive regulatory protein
VGGYEVVPQTAVLDGARPDVRLASAVAALLLQAIARGEPGDLICDVADLLGEASGPAPPSAEPAWPVQPPTWGETRVLRYLATHLSAREIAAELGVSPNTVKTHMRHLYWKLGAHSRHEAVRRAGAIGLFAASARRPWAGG